jgi:cob(I)alamin adenosyltransferase
MKKARIYTRTGDTGETGLFGGGRVSKADPRVEAYGSVDELNAALGMAIAELDAGVAVTGTLRERLAAVQPDLFAIGAHLATPPLPARRTKPKLPPLPEARITEMESWIDEGEDALPELHAFIMPGGSSAGAALHLARTVCRRAERRVLALVHAAADVDADGNGAPVPTSILVYLNRLSDYLFTAARLANAASGADERTWLPER